MTLTTQPLKNMKEWKASDKDLVIQFAPL